MSQPGPMSGSGKSSSCPGPPRARRSEASGRVMAYSSTQWPTLGCTDRVMGETGRDRSSPRSAKVLLPAVRATDRISFSRARVMATYSSRSSSAIISWSRRRATAWRARVGYWTIRSGSSPLGPTPSSGWKSTGAFKSSRFSRRLRPHTSTTGFSSPLERWMDRMDTPSPSWAGRAAVSLPPVWRSRSSRSRNWNRVRQPPSSICPARA